MRQSAQHGRGALEDSDPSRPVSRTAEAMPRDGSCVARSVTQSAYNQIRAWRARGNWRTDAPGRGDIGRLVVHASRFRLRGVLCGH